MIGLRAMYFLCADRVFAILVFSTFAILRHQPTSEQKWSETR